MNEKFCIKIRISLKVVLNGLIDNKSALVQVMAWRWTGDKPLSEPLLTHFTTQVCGTRGDELTKLISRTHCRLTEFHWYSYRNGMPANINLQWSSRCTGIDWESEVLCRQNRCHSPPLHWCYIGMMASQIAGNLNVMMTSSNGNIFRVIGPLWGESACGFPHKGQWREAVMVSLICASAYG